MQIALRIDVIVANRIIKYSRAKSKDIDESRTEDTSYMFYYRFLRLELIVQET